MGSRNKDGAWIPDPEEYEQRKAEMWAKHLREKLAEGGPSETRLGAIVDKIVAEPQILTRGVPRKVLRKD